MEARQLLSDNRGPVITVRLGDPVREAVHKLAVHNIGMVLVLDTSGKIAGILSERDVARGLDQFESELLDKRVDDLLTTSVITCAPDDNVFELVWLMDTNGIRHLPVVDDQNLLGVISIRDYMKALLTATDDETRQLRELISA